MAQLLEGIVTPEQSALILAQATHLTVQHQAQRQPNNPPLPPRTPENVGPARSLSVGFCDGPVSNKHNELTTNPAYPSPGAVPFGSPSISITVIPSVPLLDNFPTSPSNQFTSNTHQPPKHQHESETPQYPQSGKIILNEGGLVQTLQELEPKVCSRCLLFCIYLIITLQASSLGGAESSDEDNLLDAFADKQPSKEMILLRSPKL